MARLCPGTVVRLVPTLVLALGLTGAARAQEGSADGPEDEDERPLAIPAPATPPPRPPARIDVPAPPSAPSQGRVAAEYRSRQLSVRDLHGFAAHTYVTASGWGGYWGWGVGVPFAVRIDSWAVFEGGAPLDVPTTLGALGRLDEQRRLVRRIRGNRFAGTALYTVGVAGVVTSVVGLVGQDQAPTFDQARDWATVSTVGLGAIIGGFVLGSLPANKARRLQYVHGATLDVTRTREEVARHNADLARELGLEPVPRQP